MKNKYSYLSILACSIFVIACGNNDDTRKKYVSQNLSADKIKISQEVFNKIEKSHYLKNLLNMLKKLVFLQQPEQNYH